MASHIKVGKIGEEIAERYLKKKGYRILEKNYRQAYGEIDIIMQARDKTLIFVEVKTIRKNSRNDNSITPEDNMTRSKIDKLQRTCRAYASKNALYVDEKRGWRIDLVAIDLYVHPDDIQRNWWGSIIISENNCAIRHYENI